LPSIILTLYPPFYWDDISYHLPLAGEIFENHRLIFNRFIRYPVFPINGDLLFIPGLCFGPVACQVIPWLSLFTLYAGCFGEIKKRFSHFNSLAGATLLLSSQIQNGQTSPRILRERWFCKDL